MSDAIEQFTVKAGEHELSVRIIEDTYPEDPRKDFDHLGRMVCLHRQYNLGDEQLRASDHSGWDDVHRKLVRELGARIALPLYLLDHSGLTMRTDPEGFRAFDSAGWDWGQVGFIYATSDAIRKAWGVKRISKRVQALALKALIAEVEEYDQYLTGDVWGYVVEDEDGEHVDSCSGFYGLEYATQQAREAAQAAVERLAREDAAAPTYMAL